MHYEKLAPLVSETPSVLVPATQYKKCNSSLTRFSYDFRLVPVPWDMRVSKTFSCDPEKCELIGNWSYGTN